MYQGGLHISFPVIVDTASMVAGAEPDSAINKIILSLQPHVKAVTAKTAIDTAQVRISQICPRAACSSHTEGEKTSSCNNLLWAVRRSLQLLAFSPSV